MAQSSTSFKKGNQASRKNPKVVYRVFFKILENALNDKNLLDWGGACRSAGWRHTKCDYWADTRPDFGTIKKEVKSILVSRLNKGALEGDYQPAASIWRMKQLGEVDSKDINQNVSGSTPVILNLGDGVQINKETE
jgi:hypothetical protein